MFSTGEAADALGVSTKRLDNVLTGPGRLLIPTGRNGRSRMISTDVVETVAIALLLERDLGISVSMGLVVARRFVLGKTGAIPVGTLGSLHFDMVRLKSVLQTALSAVIDNRIQPRRGRPRGGTKKKRGASL